MARQDSDVRQPSSRASAIQTVAWCALGAAFLGLAAPNIKPKYSHRPWWVYHSFDNILLSLIKREGGSEHLLRVLAQLPPGPLAAVHPADDTAGILRAYIVSYLAWPRPVRLVSSPREGADNETNALLSAGCVGVFYCNLEPPRAGLPAVFIGEGLTLVPAAGAPPIVP